MAFFTSFEFATSTCFVAAPIVTDFPLTLIPDSYFIFFISIKTLQEANPNFIEGIVVIPPAKNAEFDEDNFEASLLSFAE